MGPFWEVMQKPLVIPKLSDTTLKALILGSPVPMNTFTPKWTDVWTIAYISIHNGAYL